MLFFEFKQYEFLILFDGFGGKRIFNFSMFKQLTDFFIDN